MLPAAKREKTIQGDNMTKLTPYLLFDGSCAEAMKFYQPGKCIKFRSPMHREQTLLFHLAGYIRRPPASCAPIATAACAVDGTTVAVDPNVVPLHGRISIDTIGDRTAQDTGDGIIGNHIDVFWGTMYRQCLGWGRRYGFRVNFLSYGTEN